MVHDSGFSSHSDFMSICVALTLASINGRQMVMFFFILHVVRSPKKKKKKTEPKKRPAPRDFADGNRHTISNTEKEETQIPQFRFNFLFGILTHTQMHSNIHNLLLSQPPALSQRTVQMRCVFLFSSLLLFWVIQCHAMTKNI